ncbi:MAG: High potential iron-sulfur protein [Candidimonas sp.]|nr:MAG: High potential iron-sulfur protein [Candidimonas sp.]
MKPSRRTFLIASLGAASSLALTRQAAAAPEKVSESDPQAKSLGYHLDATKIDKAKEPKYVAGEQCSNCQFFEGKPGEQYGACQVFGGKLVHRDGWCSAYVKKA